MPGTSSQDMIPNTEDDLTAVSFMSFYLQTCALCRISNHLYLKQADVSHFHAPIYPISVSVPEANASGHQANGRTISQNLQNSEALNMLLNRYNNFYQSLLNASAALPGIIANGHSASASQAILVSS